MILLDTHIWVCWVSSPERLQARHRNLLETSADRVFGVSIISCWEVAKLVEYGRLKLDRTVGLWIEGALAEPEVSLVHLNPQIVVESTQLPQPFHRDPADQLLVATAWPAPLFETTLNFDTCRSLQLTSFCAHAGTA